MKPANWHDVERTIEKISKIIGSDLREAEHILNGNLTPVKETDNRFILDNPDSAFNGVQIIVDDKKRVEFIFIPVSDEEGVLASSLPDLGKPVDIDIVSPPVVGEGDTPEWTHKYSECYLLNGRKVCFGFEEHDNTKQLVAISIESHKKIKTPEEAYKYLLKKKGFLDAGDVEGGCEAPEEFPGLFLCSITFLAEDPAGVTSYIVTADGEIYYPHLWFGEYNFDHLLKKIETLNIFPKSEEQALKMAIQLIRLRDPGDLIISDASEALRLKKLSPDAKGPEPAAPQVIKKEDYYEIIIYTFIQLPHSPGIMV
ncbi:MAG: hypothetical protein GXO97_09645, partial [Nitrospirae bacterium]|nr:hypothetical protein [Nitrospirota bacterium]